MSEDNKVHYERVPLMGGSAHKDGSVALPHDVVLTLGGGNADVGHAVLGDTLNFHPMQVPPGQIPAGVVRELGDGDIHKGRRVLRAFVARIRGQYTREHRSTKAAAHYRQGNEDRHCAICEMFVAPNICTKVKGAISRRALCDYFEPIEQNTADT